VHYVAVCVICAKTIDIVRGQIVLESGFGLYPFCLFFILTSSVADSFGIDPFSHIKITSNKASCQKSKNDPHTFIFNYIEKVNVTLADGSKITSDFLEIILNSSGINLNENLEKSTKHKKRRPHKSNKLTNVKKITFRDNVHISNKNRIACANSAIINLLENTCLLDGCVKIKQAKGKQNDVPLDVESTQALIDLKTSEITLLGSQQTPVSTVIELDKSILSPNKKHTKK
jgi:lipopolysaccharide export system protein LptA